MTKESKSKCAWLDRTLLGMAAQEHDYPMELLVDIAMEYQKHDPLVQKELEFQGNADYILCLEEELKRSRATIEESAKYIKDLKSQLQEKMN
jgi:hypothetical protein